LAPVSFDVFVSKAQQKIESTLTSLVPKEPESLYAPVRDILSAGGKRIRPLLTALAAQLGNEQSKWEYAAAAVELLHTFTLAHDDIMDNASSRRGRPTLHVRYGTNAAILSGDVIIALATESLSRGKYALLPQMIEEFAKAFREVCEGQALDKDFETRSDVTPDDYLRMIELKTARVIELAAVLGSLCTGGKYVEEMREFAHHAGVAFQVNDDLLDLTSEHPAFGKTIGGDILEGKRSFLFVSATGKLEQGDANEQALINRIASRKATQEDIVLAQQAFLRLGVLREAKERIELETRRAQAALAAIPQSPTAELLVAFSELLLSRSR
jgi:geranylgeranyl diphosphate synthase, type II